MTYRSNVFLAEAATNPQNGVIRIWKGRHPSKEAVFATEPEFNEQNTSEPSRVPKTIAWNP
jgi:hypothetical protein